MELIPNLHAFIWNSETVNNCNTYLIRSKEKNILIDPGHLAYFDHVRKGLADLGLSVEDIDMVVCTHAHGDHMESVGLFAETSALFALHNKDWEMVEKGVTVFKVAQNMDRKQYEPDLFLTEGELKVGDVSLTVYHTPGHSPGSITIHWPETGALFTGDLIFQEALGRVDLPGGNGELLKESIQQMARVDATWLLSGHGDIISGAEAVRANFEQVERFWFGYI